MPNYYELLGIARHSTLEDIKKAFRKLAMDLHPDKNPGDPTATERFIAVKEAFETLSDPNKRTVYDLTLPPDSKRPWDDLFDRFSRSTTPEYPQYTVPGADCEAEVIITLIESYTGCDKEISYTQSVICPACSGSMKPDGRARTCADCVGSGYIINAVNQQLSVCRRCSGLGKARSSCAACQSTGYMATHVVKTVPIPESVSDRSTVRYPNLGSPGTTNGDLLLTVRVTQMDDTYRIGNDLLCNCPVPLITMIDGGQVSFKSPVGTVHHFDVSPGTPSGDIRIMRGFGFKSKSSATRGDVRIRLLGEIPKIRSPQIAAQLRSILDQSSDKMT